MELFYIYTRRQSDNSQIKRNNQHDNIFLVAYIYCLGKLLYTTFIVPILQPLNPGANVPFVLVVGLDAGMFTALQL